MRMYAVTNEDETAYYSHGYENPYEAQRALDFALQHDPKAHIKEYEIETPEERCERLEAELEQVKREKDAAVKDLRMLTVNGNTCAFCKNNGGCAERQKHLDSVASCWEWRGLCKANGGEKDEEC